MRRRQPPPPTAPTQPTVKPDPDHAHRFPRFTIYVPPECRDSNVFRLYDQHGRYFHSAYEHFLQNCSPNLASPQSIFGRVSCYSDHSSGGQIAIIHLDAQRLHSANPGILNVFKTEADAVLGMWCAAFHQILQDQGVYSSAIKSEPTGDVEMADEHAPNAPLATPQVRTNASSGTIVRFTDLARVRVRLYNWADQFRLSATMPGAFVSVSGVVVRSSKVAALPTSLTFACTTCGYVVEVEQPRGIGTWPGRCEGACMTDESLRKKKNARRFFRRGANYQPPWKQIRDSGTKRIASYQVMKLRLKKKKSRPQAVGTQSERSQSQGRGRSQGGGGGSRGGGQSSRIRSVRSSADVAPSVTIEIWDHDLLNQVIPGDFVVVCGFVRSLTYQELTGRKQRSAQSEHKSTVLQANSLMLQARDRRKRSSAPAPASAQGRPNDGSSFFERSGLMDRQMTHHDLQGFDLIRNHPRSVAMIVNSVAPGIFGHEIVKMGLAMALFGGVRKFSADGERVAVRGDSHVLVCGDPGQGKSQMLQSIEAIAPRAVYVCSQSGTTTRGLTVAVLQDGNDFHIEGGALVLAHRGVCCIDEFDKLGKSDIQALLEAMEQQVVSVSRAGIQCAVPSRCTVIAAANPVDGHYRRAKTVAENINMLPAMLSRFDLVFVLQDKGEFDRDSRLARFVLDVHDGSGPAAPSRAGGHLRRSNYPANSDPSQGEADVSSLSQLLRNPPEDVVPAGLFKKYITHARKNIIPTMSPGAKALIKNFYVTLRARHHSVHATPITTRQLESMVRLSEARARMELRDVVTEQDAADVIAVMKKSFLDLLVNADGEVELSRMTHGRSSSAQAILREINRVMNTTQKSTITDTELNGILGRLSQGPPDLTKLKRALQRLKHDGTLLQSGSRSYRLGSSSS